VLSNVQNAEGASGKSQGGEGAVAFRLLFNVLGGGRNFLKKVLAKRRERSMGGNNQNNKRPGSAKGVMVAVGIWRASQKGWAFDINLNN
jgi:hypothetical protein